MGARFERLTLQAHYCKLIGRKLKGSKESVSMILRTGALRVRGPAGGAGPGVGRLLLLGSGQRVTELREELYHVVDRIIYRRRVQLMHQASNLCTAVGIVLEVIPCFEAAVAAHHSQPVVVFDDIKVWDVSQSRRPSLTALCEEA